MNRKFLYKKLNRVTLHVGTDMNCKETFTFTSLFTLNFF